jgi:hypothetical protein
MERIHAAWLRWRALFRRGQLERAELVTALCHRLTGDADANGVLGLVMQDGFHRGRPWIYDGTRAALAEHKERFRQLSRAEARPWHFGLGAELGDMLRSAVLVFVSLGVMGLLLFGLRQLF